MRIVLLFIICGKALLSNAQWLPTFYDSIDYKNEILVSGNVDISASAIYKELSSVFYRGGHISSEMIQRSLERHGAVNRIGVDLSSEITYRNFNPLFKNRDIGFQVKAGAYYFGGLLYSKDLFDLAMNGNSEFFGDTADLSGADLSFTAFQKVGFGLLSTKSRSSLSLNFYNIQDRIDLTMRDAHLIHSPDYDSIVISADGSYTGKSNRRFDQGFGLGIDLEYYMPFQWGSGKTSYIEFKANNIGFGYMTQEQTTYRMDTSVTYSGFRFDQLFGDNPIDFASLDILDTLGVRKSSTKKAFLLPGFIQVAKIVDERFEGKWQPFFGIRVYPTLVFSPMAFAGLDFAPMKQMHLGLSASYGGFAKFRAGFYASYALSRFRFGLGSENLVGVISKKGNGESINFRLSCVF